MFLKNLYKTPDNYSLRFRESNLLVDNDTPIGIEIELENYNKAHNPHPLTYWEVTEDGSLRPRDTGREYVSGINYNQQAYIPLAGENIVKALKEFQEVLDYNAPYLPTISKRCSIHVHVGVGNLTSHQLYDLVLIYLILEKVLYRYADPTFARWTNNYCIPLCQTQNLLDILYLLKQYNFKHIVDATTKYDGLNLFSISKKGTIEFRMHPGCYDTKHLLEWINILLSLKKYAIEKKESWLTILSSISGKGPSYFLKGVFGDLTPALETPESDSDIYDGIRVAQYVEYRDSSSYPDNLTSYPPKLEKLAKFKPYLKRGI